MQQGGSNCFPDNLKNILAIDLCDHEKENMISNSKPIYPSAEEEANIILISNHVTVTHFKAKLKAPLSNTILLPDDANFH